MRWISQRSPRKGKERIQMYSVRKDMVSIRIAQICGPFMTKWLDDGLDSCILYSIFWEKRCGLPACLPASLPDCLLAGIMCAACAVMGTFHWPFILPLLGTHLVAWLASLLLHGWYLLDCTYGTCCLEHGQKESKQLSNVSNSTHNFESNSPVCHVSFDKEKQGVQPDH